MIVSYAKGQTIFRQGHTPLRFYQIITGSVRMYYTDEEGNEFTLGTFTSNDSFGEPPLFIDKCYPGSAVANSETSILQLSKDNFNKLLYENPSTALSLLITLSLRLYNKSILSRMIAYNTSEDKLLVFLNNIKSKQGATNMRVLIPYTRKDIATQTGLRTETVIRTLNKMKENGIVQIVNRKIYF